MRLEDLRVGDWVVARENTYLPLHWECFKRDFPMRVCQVIWVDYRNNIVGIGKSGPKASYCFNPDDLIKLRR